MRPILVIALREINRLRARFSRERYAEEVERVKALLRAGKEPHLAEFLQVWESVA